MTRGLALLAAVAVGCGHGKGVSGDAGAEVAGDVGTEVSEDVAPVVDASDAPIEAGDDASDASPDTADAPGRVALPWSAPTTLDPLAVGGSATPLIRMDDAGNAIVISRHVGLGTVVSIEALRFDKATEAWSAAAALETNDIDTATDPDLDVDAAGNAVVVWTQASLGLASIWSSRFDAATKTWHGPALVEIEDQGEAAHAGVATLPSGGAVAAWHQWDGLRQSLWANQMAGGVWTKRALLETTDSADAVEPDVAADPAGNTVVVWTQTDDDDENTVWSSTRAAGADAWGAPRMLGVAGATQATITPTPRVALDDKGDGLAIWSLRTDGIWSIWASRYHVTTDTWDAAVLIETDDRGSASSPSLALDAKGNATATWRQSDGTYTRVMSNRFVARTATWTGAVRVDDLNGAVLLPFVSAAGDGHAVIAWGQSTSAADVRASRFDPVTGTWGPSALVDVWASPANPPQVAIDAAGNAIAVWTQLFGGKNALLAATQAF